MSQTSITTKYAISAFTGTAGTTFNASGRDANQIISWRGVIDATVPASDKVLQTSGSLTQKNGQVNGWKSKTTLNVPVMEVLASGTTTGYLAQPRVNSALSVTISVFRPATMTSAVAQQALEELAYAILANDVNAPSAQLVTAMIGYAPADA